MITTWESFSFPFFQIYKETHCENGCVNEIPILWNYWNLVLLIDGRTFLGSFHFFFFAERLTENHSKKIKNTIFLSSILCSGCSTHFRWFFSCGFHVFSWKWIAEIYMRTLNLWLPISPFVLIFPQKISCASSFAMVEQITDKDK